MLILCGSLGSTVKLGKSRMLPVERKISSVSIPKPVVSFLVMKPIASLLIIATLSIAACSTSRPVSAKERYFTAHVKPVLEANCLRCHQTATAPAGLNLSNREGALSPRSPRTGRPFIIPGDPDCSLLVAAISRKGTHPKIMPRLEMTLTEDQIGDLSEWIEDGAYWPKGNAGQLHPVFNPENP